MRGLSRSDETRTCATAARRLDTDAAGVRLDDCFDDRQAETAAPRGSAARGFASVEALEDPGEIGVGDPGARVAHAHGQAAGRAGASQNDFAAGGRVAQPF